LFIHDHSRQKRIGQSEVIFCEGKHIIVLQKIFDHFLSNKSKSVLFTRMSEGQYSKLENKPESFDYEPLSKTAILNGCAEKTHGNVAIVSAGSSDLFVSREVCRTLEYFGVQYSAFEDLGVAGLWRLQERLPEISTYDIVVVVAGMDAAIVSVLGGLVSMPIIAVPTSIGYGVTNNGETALHAALCSCAQGVVVVNIDNGFGGACAAVRILSTHK